MLSTSEDRRPPRGRAPAANLFAGLALGVVIGAVGGFSHWALQSSDLVPGAGGYAGLSLFGAAFEKVRENYVDRPDDRALVRSAINGMLASLDPHSGYVDGPALRKTNAFVRGEIGDVGIELAEQGGALTIVSPVEGASAAHAGLLPGDTITEIDGVPTRGLLLDEAGERLRGPIASRVRLTVHRFRGATEQVSITRDVQSIKSVRSHRLDGGIGYIRIAQFTEATASSLNDALRKLAANGPGNLRGYILDLRNDPGGFVDQAIATVNAFIDDGVIVSTRGRSAGSGGQIYAKPGNNLSEGRPLVVLVNGGTASAAEIVAGALQDLKRATLVGARTFGKGSIQSTLPLGDGELRLTTALYFTPSGRSIQAEGIVPDEIVLQDTPPEFAGKYASAGEASLSRHLVNPRGEDPGPSQTWVPSDPKADKQLLAAVNFLRK